MKIERKPFFCFKLMYALEVPLKKYSFAQKPLYCRFLYVHLSVMKNKTDIKY